MKNAKLISIIACLVAVVLLAASFIFGFTRGVDSDWSYVINASLNDPYEVKDVEAIFAQTGASEFMVQRATEAQDITKATDVVITFKAADAEEAKAIFDKAEELLSDKYMLKFPGTLNAASATINTKTMLSYWPALIVLVVIVAYAFIRFEVRGGLMVLLMAFITLASTVGIISITGIRLTFYTVPALLLTATISFILSFIMANLLKDNEAKIENTADALALSIKASTKLSVCVCALAVIAFAIMLILGGIMFKNFALTVLVGVAVNLLASVFVMPALVSCFGKEK